MSLPRLCVSLSIFTRGGDNFVDIYILKSLSQKVIRSDFGVSLSVLKAKVGGGEYLNIYICYVTDPVFLYNLV